MAVPLLVLLLGVMTLPAGLFGSLWEEPVAVLLALSSVPLMAAALLGPLRVMVLPKSAKGGCCLPSVCWVCWGVVSALICA